LLCQESAERLPLAECWSRCDSSGQLVSFEEQPQQRKEIEDVQLFQATYKIGRIVDIVT
jgi:hypothetical protein